MFSFSLWSDYIYFSHLGLLSWLPASISSSSLRVPCMPITIHPNGFETKPGGFAYPHLKLLLSITSLLHNITTTYQLESCFPRPSVPRLPTARSTCSNHALSFLFFWIVIFTPALSTQDQGSTAAAHTQLPPSHQTGRHLAEQQLCYVELYLCYSEVDCPCRTTPGVVSHSLHRWLWFPVSESRFTSQTIALLNLESCFVSSCDLHTQAEGCHMNNSAEVAWHFPCSKHS